MDSVQISSAGETASAHSHDRIAEARLQQLIPIVMVIVGGCEACAEKMVTRALNEGCDWLDIDRTLRITAGTQRLDCFAKAVGSDVVSRMDKPLAAGRKTLEIARMSNQSRTCGRASASADSGQ